MGMSGGCGGSLKGSFAGSIGGRSGEVGVSGISGGAGGCGGISGGMAIRGYLLHLLTGINPPSPPEFLTGQQIVAGSRVKRAGNWRILGASRYGHF